MAEPLVVLEGVTKSFGTEVVTEVLHGIDLEIRPAEFTALVGPSGSGKSTLLNLLGLLDRPTTGRIFLAGRDTTGLSENERSAVRGRTLGFVFQFHHLLPGVHGPRERDDADARGPGTREEGNEGAGLLPSRGDRPRGPRPLQGDEALGRPAAARRGGEGARPRARLSSSRTSRPGTSTPNRARRSSSSCGGSPPSTGRRSSSSRTTSGSRPAATGSSRWWTGGSARTSGTRGPEGREPPGIAGRLSRQCGLAPPQR